MSNSYSLNDVNLCYKNTCIQAKGNNAKIIVFCVSAMLILWGIAAFKN